MVNDKVMKSGWGIIPEGYLALFAVGSCHYPSAVAIPDIDGRELSGRYPKLLFAGLLFSNTCSQQHWLGYSQRNMELLLIQT